MSYTPVTDYESRQLPVNGGDETSYTLAEIPDSATEVLIYFFVSVRDNNLPEIKRSYYEITTKDNSGTEYTKFMNVIFTIHDYVMNSENIWLPISSDKKLTVHLQKGYAWPAAHKVVRQPRTHKNLPEAMTDFHDCNDPDAVFAEFFVTGYR